MAEKSTSQKDQKKADREARLAKALRDNLRRRKQAGAPQPGQPSSAGGGESDGDQGENKA